MDDALALLVVFVLAFKLYLKWRKNIGSLRNAENISVLK